MKKLVLTVPIFISFYAFSFLHAASTDSSKASVSSPVKTSLSKNSTNINFDYLLIQGHYHFSDESIVTVEQDKALDALLGVRKDFKDRLKQSARRN